jgi:hypothetical protein
MKIAEFDIGIGRSEGEIIKENDKTVIVRLRRGGKTVQVKRHIEKHRVVVVGEME